MAENRNCSTITNFKESCTMVETLVLGHQTDLQNRYSLCLCKECHAKAGIVSKQSMSI